MAIYKIENQDPLSLLVKIVELSQSNLPDPRAQVTLHGGFSKSWTGIPTKIVEGQLGRFVVLSDLGSEKSCYVALSQIAAFEIENASRLESFFKKPWSQDPKYSGMTKLQANRELEALGKSFHETQFRVKFETFPSDDEVYSNIIAWTVMFRATMEKMMSDPLAKEAIEGIKIFEIGYEAAGLKGQKNGSQMAIEVNLNPECFQVQKIENLLNEIL